MQTHTIRRVPWTCEWGRFGVAAEELGGGRARVDDVFWGCHRPSGDGAIRLTKRGECDTCPFWIEAARLRTHD